MKFNQIRDFVAVAENGSLRAAARKLGLAQPAITRSVQELERSLNAQLFVRGARGVTLTEIGKVLLVRSASILEDIRRAREEIEQLQGSVEGELAVGMSAAGHLGVLPYVFTRFRSRYPDVKIRVVEGFLPTLQDDILKGRLDFYVGGVASGPQSAELLISKIFDNERVVIGRKKHPMAGATSLSALADAEWLTTSVTDQAVDELMESFSDRGLPAPRLVCECQSAMSIASILTASDLLAMVPRQWMDSPLFQHALVALKLTERFGSPALMLVQRSGLGLTPAAQHFVDLVERLKAD